MRQQDSGIWPLIVVALAIAFVVSWCHLPSNAGLVETEHRDGAFEGVHTYASVDALEWTATIRKAFITHEWEEQYGDTDLPVMVLGVEEGRMMKQHLIDTGEYTEDKGYYYFIRTYDAGRAKPPGIDEYYDLTVYMIYVPAIATGFNIGLEYSLREGKTDKYRCNEVRKIIQYHLDDADEDLIPNSMLKVELETRYGAPTKHEIKPVDAMQEWRYWVYFWYSTFLKEGMK